MRRRAAALFGATAWLAACTSSQWVYEKRSVTPAQYDRDVSLCRKEAHDPRTLSLPGTPRVDRAVFNTCMEKKGYTVRTEK
jgi:hypothetical protein